MRTPFHKILAAVFAAALFLAAPSLTSAGIMKSGLGRVALEPCRADNPFIIGHENPDGFPQVAEPDHCIHIYYDFERQGEDGPIMFTLPQAQREELSEQEDEDKHAEFPEGDFNNSLEILDELRDGQEIFYQLSVTGAAESLVITAVEEPRIVPLEDFGVSVNAERGEDGVYRAMPGDQIWLDAAVNVHNEYDDFFVWNIDGNFLECERERTIWNTCIARSPGQTRIATTFTSPFTGAQYRSGEAVLRIGDDGLSSRLIRDIKAEESFSDEVDQWSYGAAWADVNLDGNEDLFITSNRPSQNNDLFNSFFQNRYPDRSPFYYQDALNSAGEAYHVSWADFDNDGDRDPFLTGDKMKLFENQGVGDERGPPLFEEHETWQGDNAFHTTATWGDYNKDGLLDFFTTRNGNEIWENKGDGEFEFVDSPITAAGNNSIKGIWTDYDDDGDLDLFIANSGGGNFLFRNNGGVFERIEDSPLVADDIVSTDAFAGDFTGDGRLDFLLMQAKQILPPQEDNPENTFASLILYVNEGGGRYAKREQDFPQWESANFDLLSSNVADIDNDGDLDVFARELLENNGDGFFLVRQRVECGNCALADYNRDGFIDMYSGGQELQYFYKNLPNQNNSAAFTLVGRRPGSNRDAIGAKIRIRTTINGASYDQVREVASDNNSIAVEFGLGSAQIIDELEIRWPSGYVQRIQNLSVNVDNGAKRNFVIREPLDSLVADPDMEAPNAASWRGYGRGGPFSKRNCDNGYCFSLKQSLGLEAPFGGSAGVQQLNIPVQAGKTYRLQFAHYVKNGASLRPMLGIRTSNSDFQNILTDLTGRVEPQWAVYSRDFRVPDNFAGDFRLVFIARNNTALIDDVILQEIDPMERQAIADADMELTGAGSWRPWGNAGEFSKNHDGAISGLQSMLINGSGGAGAVQQTGIALDAGARYEFSFRYREYDGIPGTLQPLLGIRDSNRDFEGKWTILRPGNDAALYRREFTVPQNFTGDFRILFIGRGGASLIDDVLLRHL